MTDRSSLQPAQNGAPTRPRPDIRDSSSPLRWFVVLLIGLPSGLVFAPLGAAGAPAAILGLGFFAWWINARFVPQLGVHRGRQPIRVALYAFLLAAAFGYLAGAMRPLSSAEASSSIRFILTIVSWAGVTLVTADGLKNRESVDRLLRFVVWGGAFLATLGLIQFFSGWNPASLIVIPGLELKTAVGSLDRGNFTRVQGTAAHAIEFGVVMSIILPLAFHYAWFAPSRRRLNWAPVLLIGMGLPLTVSRSAILGLAIVMVVLGATWPREWTWKVLRVMPFMLVALQFVVPGLLHTIKGLFLNFNSDPSTQGRKDDYVAAGFYIHHTPIFGRGIGTFIPELYRTLDNAYLGWVLETGFLGLFLLIVFIVISIGTGFHIRTRAGDDAETRDLGSSLAASLMAMAFNLGTFDGFGFAMCSGLFFLLIGAVGALWRLAPGPGRINTQTLPQVRWTQRLTTARKSLGLIAPILGAAAGVLLVSIPGVVKSDYVASASILLFGPVSSAEVNPYLSGPYLTSSAEVIKRLVMSGDTAAELRRQGFSDQYTIASVGGSLMPLTDKMTQGTPLVIEVHDRTADGVIRSRDAVVAELQRLWRDSQLSVGSPERELIPARVGSTSKIPIPEFGAQRRAQIAAGGIGGALGGIGYYLLRFLLRGRVERRPGADRVPPARSGYDRVGAGHA